MEPTTEKKDFREGKEPVPFHCWDENEFYSANGSLAIVFMIKGLPTSIFKATPDEELTVANLRNTQYYKVDDETMNRICKRIEKQIKPEVLEYLKKYF